MSPFPWTNRITEADTRIRWALYLACAVLAVTTVVAGVYAVLTSRALDQQAGIWCALADDLVKGIFYRPILSEDGYGGTRYFPLHFLLHAAGIQLGLGMRPAGHLLSVSATLLLALAVYLLLRRLGSDRSLAVVASILIFASSATQHALATIRGDALPAALNLWGLVLCTRTDARRREIIGAALLFALAFSAKVTTVFGLAAGVLCFVSAGDRRRALWLSALTAAGYTFVLVAMQAASDGRALEIMRACGSAGGTFADLVRGPRRLLRVMLTKDPGILPFVAFALAAFLARSGKELIRLPPLYFLAAGGATVLIFGSPGAYTNHLMDLHVAAVVLGVWWVSTTTGRERTSLLAVLTVAALLSCEPILYEMRRLGGFSLENRIDGAVSTIDEVEGPILSDQPLIPVLRNENAYVIDSFLFCVLAKRDANFSAPLLRRLRERSFGAVALLHDPRVESGRDWYETKHFGTPFLKTLEQNYDFSERTYGCSIYRPRGP